PSTCASAASSSGVTVAVEYSRNSGVYCRQVSAGNLFIVALTGKNHFGRLVHYLVDDIRHGKDGKDGRSKDDDPDSRRCRIQLVVCPAEALAPAPQPAEEERP